MERTYNINGHEFIYKKLNKEKFKIYKCKNCGLEGLIYKTFGNDLWFFDIFDINSYITYEGKDIYTISSCDEYVVKNIIE